MNDDIYNLAKQIIKTLRTQNLTIATAESCTGGGIGAALTAISGSSSVFEGGIISYSNDAKTNLLGVPKKTIKTHGAVSGQTAKAMAKGARKALVTDIAISVTGIAGPTGGSEAKPVGTVWIGLAVKGQDATSKHFLFEDNGRDSVRNATILAALEMLMRLVRTK